MRCVVVRRWSPAQADGSGWVWCFTIGGWLVVENGGWVWRVMGVEVLHLAVFP